MDSEKYIFDAVFSFGIKNEDISFEIAMLDKKMTPIIYMADNENEKLPTHLLFDKYGIPLPRKPIVYQYIVDEQIEKFNINPLMEPYNNIGIYFTKSEYCKITKFFKKEQWTKIKRLNVSEIPLIQEEQ